MKPTDPKYIDSPYPVSDYFSKEQVKIVDIELFHRQEWIPIEYVRVYLRVTHRKMINILEFGYEISGNYIRIETDKDEEKEYYYSQQAFPNDCAPFFSRAKDILQVNIHISSWEKILEARGENIFYPHLTNKCDTFLREKSKSQSEVQLTEAELRKALDEKDARIAQLERALATAKAEPVTTVNAAKWEGSVAAAFGVWADIVAGNKTDWKEDEFRSAIEARCTDYHTKVHAIAWNLLPDEFKNGRGRPKKKPEKSQQPDNS